MLCCEQLFWMPSIGCAVIGERDVMESNLINHVNVGWLNSHMPAIGGIYDATPVGPSTF